jgi:hypothetical protein
MALIRFPVIHAFLRRAYVGLPAALLAACAAEETFDPVYLISEEHERQPAPAHERLLCRMGSIGMQVGTATDDEFTGVAIHNSHVYVSGYVHGLARVTDIEPAGDSAAFLMKLRPSGAFEWQLALDTLATDTFEDVLVRPDGSTVVVGRTNGALPGFTNQGQFDTVLGTVSPEGALVDAAQIGDERPQHPRRLSAGRGASFALAGYDDVYVPSNYVDRWYDGFVGRFDLTPDAQPAITEQWLRQSNTPEGDVIVGVAVNPSDESMAIAGERHWGINPGPYVERLLADGTSEWRRSLTHSSGDAISAIDVSPRGHLIVAASLLHTKGVASQNLMVRRIDWASGQTMWVKHHGSGESDWASAITSDLRGNIYVAGTTMGSMAGHANKGGNDIFVLKLDEEGALVQAWQEGTPQEDYVSDIAVGPCGDIVIVGYTEGALFAPDGHKGRRDAFVMSIKP